MWKAAFTGRSEKASDSTSNATSRKKSSKDSSSVVSSSSTKRSTGGDRSRGDKSRGGSVYGDEDLRSSAPSTSRSLTESAVRGLNGYERDDDWQDEDVNTKVGGSRSENGRTVRKSERKQSVTSVRDSRDEKRRSDRGKESSRQSRSVDQEKEDKASDRAIPDMGSFQQFPGQYSDGMIGPGPDEHVMSGALPQNVENQFPGQQLGPSRADSYGAAADYYLDEGQSVDHQPGVRPLTPNMLVNGDPHLVAASLEAHPVADTGHGSAADFFEGRVTPILTEEPQSIDYGKPSKPNSNMGPDRPYKPSRASSLGAAAAATAAAAIGIGAIAAGSHQSSHDQNSSSYSFQQTTTNSQSARPDRFGRYNSNPSPPMPSGGRPSPGIPSNQSSYPAPGPQGKPPSSGANNTGLYAAGAAAAGVAAYEMYEHSQQHQGSSSKYGGSASSGRPPSYAPQQPLRRNGETVEDFTETDIYRNEHYHEHSGPISRLKDGFFNLISSKEDTAKMEVYTQYIGVCKYCFDPRSTPWDGPRQHHFHPSRRDSFESLRHRRSIERMQRRSSERLSRTNSQRVDKDSRYYGSGRSSNKNDLIGAGLAAAGVAGAAGLASDMLHDDLDGGYSIKSGHRPSSAARRRSRSSSREKRRRSTYGTISKESKEEYVTVRTSDGRIEKRRVRRSRSGSKERKSSSGVLGAAAAGAALGGAAALASGSRSDRESTFDASRSNAGRRRSPRGSYQDVSRHSDRQRRSSYGSSDDGGGLFGFFSPPRRKRSKRRGRSPRRETQGGGFFSFSNDSLSDTDLAFGDGMSGKNALPLRRRSSARMSGVGANGRVRKKKSDEHFAETLAGLGATATALAAYQRGSRVGASNGRPELGAKRNVQHHTQIIGESQHGHAPPDDEGWEDELPSDVDDESSVGADLAFGDFHHGYSAQHSQEHLGAPHSPIEDASGSWGWGWGWGGKNAGVEEGRYPAPRPTGYPYESHDPSLIGSAAAGMAAGAVASAAMNGAGRTTSSSNSVPQRPMQYVDPRPISETSLPGSRRPQSSMPGAFDGMAPVRPDPAPIQQPKPVAPFQPSFTDELNHRPIPERTQTAPSRGSMLQDAALIGAAAIGTAGIIASQSGRRSKEAKDVRFGFTEEQQLRHERELREEQEKTAEARRKAAELQSLKEEAERHLREQEVLRARAEENRRKAEREIERQRAAEAETARQAELTQQRERAAREREEADRREQARLAAEARRREEERRQWEEQAAERAQKEAYERERAKRERRDSNKRGNESASGVNWGDVAAGTAAVAAVGAVAAGVKHEESRYKDTESRDNVEAEAEIMVPTQHPSAGDLPRDEDIEDPNFFKKRSTSVNYNQRAQDLARRAADRITAERIIQEQDEYYATPAPSQADFFAPQELLEKKAQGKTKEMPPMATGVEDLVVYSVADDVNVHSFLSTDGLKKHAPYGVPRLGLIAPTPPPSSPNFRPKDQVRSKSPLSQEAETASETESAAERKSERSKSISWGEDKTHVYDVHSPDSVEDHERTSYVQDHDLQEAATVAAGGVAAAAAAGIGAEIYEHSKSKKSQESPSRSREQEEDNDNDVEEVHDDGLGDQSRFYRRPFYDSVSDFDMSGFKVASPGTEGAPPVQGYVEEDEVEGPTPVAEKEPHIPGGWDEDEVSSKTTESKTSQEATSKELVDETTFDSTRDSAMKEREELFEEPAWEPPLSKKDKKKKDKQAKKQGFADIAEVAMSAQSKSSDPPAEYSEPTREVEDNVVASDLGLSKKDKKKQAKKQGFADFAAFAMSAQQPSSDPSTSASEAAGEVTDDVPEYGLSKKEKKKREKAAKRASITEDLFDQPTPAVEEDKEIPQVEPAAEAEAEAEWEPPLSKKDKKKRDKAAKRASITEDFTEEPVDTPEYSREVPQVEPEAEWEPPLSKKDKKKRDKQAKQAGFANVAEALMAAGGATAIAGAATVAAQDNQAEGSHYRTTGRSEADRFEDFEQDRRDYVEEKEQEGREPPQVQDPFQYQVQDELPREEAATAEADPFTEFAETKKSKKKKKRDSLRYSDPVEEFPYQTDMVSEEALNGNREVSTSAQVDDSQNVFVHQPQELPYDATPPKSSSQPPSEEPQTELEPTSTKENIEREEQDEVDENYAYSNNVSRTTESQSERTDRERDHDRNRDRDRDRDRDDYYDRERDSYNDRRSEAPSEPADAYESSRKSKRRSRTYVNEDEDDDTASVATSRSRREKDPSPTSSKKEKRSSGLFGIFSRKSTDPAPQSSRDDGAPLSRSSTREDRDEAEGHGERRRRRRSEKDSEYGDDDDARSYVTSSSSHRTRSSRHNEDEDDYDDREHRHHHRHRSGDSEYSSRPRTESDSRHRHHHRRRTDEEKYDQDQSFLGMRVEDLPPLPDSAPVSPVSAPFKPEQDNGSPVSAGPSTILDNSNSERDRDVPQTILYEPAMTIEHAMDFESLPALPESSPTSPIASVEFEPSHQPLSTEQNKPVPVRFLFGGGPPPTPSPRMSRATSFASPAVSSPMSPSAQKTRQTRPHSNEFRPLYLVERNRKTPEVEDFLPSLPSSKPSSRASSLVGSEEYESAVEDHEEGSPVRRRRALTIETGDFGSFPAQEDYLDSQQTTPKASSFPELSTVKPPKQEPQFYTWEDLAEDERRQSIAAPQFYTWDDLAEDERRQGIAAQQTEATSSREIHHEPMIETHAQTIEDHGDERTVDSQALSHEQMEDLPTLPLSRPDSPTDNKHDSLLATATATAVALGGAALIADAASQSKADDQDQEKSHLPSETHVSSLEGVDVADVGASVDANESSASREVPMEEIKTPDPNDRFDEGLNSNVDESKSQLEHAEASIVDSPSKPEDTPAVRAVSMEEIPISNPLLNRQSSTKKKKGKKGKKSKGTVQLDMGESTESPAETESGATSSRENDSFLGAERSVEESRIQENNELATVEVREPLARIQTDDFLEMEKNMEDGEISEPPTAIETGPKSRSNSLDRFMETEALLEQGGESRGSELQENRDISMSSTDLQDRESGSAGTFEHFATDEDTDMTKENQLSSPLHLTEQPPHKTSDVDTADFIEEEARMEEGIGTSLPLTEQLPREKPDFDTADFVQAEERLEDGDAVLPLVEMQHSHERLPTGDSDFTQTEEHRGEGAAILPLLEKHHLDDKLDIDDTNFVEAKESIEEGDTVPTAFEGQHVHEKPKLGESDIAQPLERTEDGDAVLPHFEEHYLPENPKMTDSEFVQTEEQMEEGNATLPLLEEQIQNARSNIHTPEFVQAEERTKDSGATATSFSESAIESTKDDHQEFGAISEQREILPVVEPAADLEEIHTDHPQPQETGQRSSVIEPEDVESSDAFVPLLTRKQSKKSKKARKALAAAAAMAAFDSNSPPSNFASENNMSDSPDMQPAAQIDDSAAAIAPTVEREVNQPTETSQELGERADPGEEEGANIAPIPIPAPTSIVEVDPEDAFGGFAPISRKKSKKNKKKLQQQEEDKEATQQLETESMAEETATTAEPSMAESQLRSTVDADVDSSSVNDTMREVHENEPLATSVASQEVLPIIDNDLKLDSTLQQEPTPVEDQEEIAKEGLNDEARTEELPVSTRNIVIPTESDEIPAVEPGETQKELATESQKDEPPAEYLPLAEEAEEFSWALTVNKKSKKGKKGKKTISEPSAIVEEIAGDPDLQLIDSIDPPAHSAQQSDQVFEPQESEADILWTSQKSKKKGKKGKKGSVSTAFEQQDVSSASMTQLDEPAAFATDNVEETALRSLDAASADQKPSGEDFEAADSWEGQSRKKKKKGKKNRDSEVQPSFESPEFSQDAPAPRSIGDIGLTEEPLHLQETEPSEPIEDDWSTSASSKKKKGKKSKRATFEAFAYADTPVGTEQTTEPQQEHAIEESMQDQLNEDKGIEPSSAMDIDTEDPTVELHQAAREENITTAAEISQSGHEHERAMVTQEPEQVSENEPVELKREDIDVPMDVGEESHQRGDLPLETNDQVMKEASLPSLDAMDLPSLPDSPTLSSNDVDDFIEEGVSERPEESHHETVDTEHTSQVQNVPSHEGEEPNYEQPHEPVLLQHDHEEVDSVQHDESERQVSKTDVSVDDVPMTQPDEAQLYPEVARETEAPNAGLGETNIESRTADAEEEFPVIINEGKKKKKGKKSRSSTTDLSVIEEKEPEATNPPFDSQDTAATDDRNDLASTAEIAGAIGAAAVLLPQTDSQTDSDWSGFSKKKSKKDKRKSKRTTSLAQTTDIDVGPSQRAIEPETSTNEQSASVDNSTSPMLDQGGEAAPVASTMETSETTMHDKQHTLEPESELKLESAIPNTDSFGPEATFDSSRDIDFTATVAAGLADSGFSPDLVINDDSFQRRSSPPAVVGEADPEEFTMSFSKQRKKGKGKKAKPSIAQQDKTLSEGPTESEGITSTDKDGDFDSMIEQTLSSNGFDATLLQQTLSSGSDAATNDVAGDADFSFATSKRKKKARKTELYIPVQDAQEAESVFSQPEVAGDETKGEPSMLPDMSEPVLSQPHSQEKDHLAITSTTDDITTSDPNTESALQSEAEPHLAEDNLHIAGDQDLDVEEMDRKYKAFKKNKRNRRKQEAAAAAAAAARQSEDTEQFSEQQEEVVETKTTSRPFEEESARGRSREVFEDDLPVQDEAFQVPSAEPVSHVQAVFPGMERVKRRKPSVHPSSSFSETTGNVEEATDLDVSNKNDISTLPAAAAAASGMTIGKSIAMAHARHHHTDSGSPTVSNKRSLGLLPGDRQGAQSKQPSWSFDVLAGANSAETELEGREIARDSGFEFAASSARDSIQDSDHHTVQSQTDQSRDESSLAQPELEPESTLLEHGNIAKEALSRENSLSPPTHGRTPSQTTEDTPLQSTSKHRTSYLFQTPPGANIDSSVGDPTTPSQDMEASDHFRTRSRETFLGTSETIEEADRGEVYGDPSFSSPRAVDPMSLAAGLGTIPEEHHPPKRAISDDDGSEPELKAANRSETPQSIRQMEQATMSALSSTYSSRSARSPLSPDENMIRTPWASGAEANISNVLERGRNRPHRLPDDFRSPSVLSNRSNASAGHFKSPTDLRSFSRSSNRSSTPTLRRTSMSGDLRAASVRGDSGSAVGARSSPKTIPFEAPPTPPPNDDDAVLNVGGSRSIDMADVYSGIGDAQGSQTSPTRPPSMRKRQSMHVMELESKVDQLMAENQVLHEAKLSRGDRGRDEASALELQETLASRDLQLREKDNQINQIRAMLQPMQDEIARLTEINGGLTEANKNLVDDTNGRYATLQQEHAHAHEQWQNASRELEDMRDQHGQITSNMRVAVESEIATALADKNTEIRSLREELDIAAEKIRALQVQVQTLKKGDYLSVRDEDYFDGACQKLCQHVQQWVLRFSKLSDDRICRLSSDLNDDKIEARIDNAILDGSDTDKLLGDRVRRRDIFMSVVMTMVWEYVFTRYLFGMDREQRQKLKALEKILAEVGPPRAVAQWRATTLTLLSKRPGFVDQRDLDTEAVASEVFALLCALLPPPSNSEEQLMTSLIKVIGIAADLSIEMRTQRAEYIMLPPLQPEYDTNGDLVRKVHFNSSLMNERSGVFGSNEELEQTRAVVKIVLFPLVVKKGDEFGEGEDEIVVCPAQVLVQNESGRSKKIVRVQSGAMEIDDPRRSRQSLMSTAPTNTAH